VLIGLNYVANGSSIARLDEIGVGS
jgi:hypothetical protein